MRINVCVCDWDWMWVFQHLLPFHSIHCAHAFHMQTPPPPFYPQWCFLIFSDFWHLHLNSGIFWHHVSPAVTSTILQLVWMGRGCLQYLNLVFSVFIRHIPTKPDMTFHICLHQIGCGKCISQQEEWKYVTKWQPRKRITAKQMLAAFPWLPKSWGPNSTMMVFGVSPCSWSLTLYSSTLVPREISRNSLVILGRALRGHAEVVRDALAKESSNITVDG